MKRLSTSDTMRYRLVFVTRKIMAESAYTVHAIVKMKSRVLDSILTY